MKRDSQKSKVYASEMPMHNDYPQIEWDEVVAFADKVMNSAYVIRKYGHRSISVLKGRSGGHAHTGLIKHDAYERQYVFHGAAITLGVWARRKSVILHELAHHFAGISHGHDWRFAEVQLDLVRHFLGKDEAERLKASYKANRVRFSKPRKRNFTPEQRAAAAARLAVARAAKAAKAESA